eukprot:GILI01077409.1.p1 GENE.GILI01077409.1~~GILI01077409.1.p1  ORF type:complete len:101 (+),score=16.30 GILI01077409.1:97-399(+)
MASLHLVSEIGFLPYLPMDNPEVAALQSSLSAKQRKSAEQRLQYLQVTNDDLSSVLSFPYAKFWSQIKIDKSLRKFLDTYLRYSRRPYEGIDQDLSQLPP